MALEFSKNISTFITVFCKELHGIYHTSSQLFFFFLTLTKLEECLSKEEVCRYMDGKKVCYFPLS